MQWHVWLRNLYCGTVGGSSHQEALRVAERTWGTSGSLHVFRVTSTGLDFSRPAASSPAHSIVSPNGSSSERRLR